MQQVVIYEDGDGKVRAYATAYDNAQVTVVVGHCAKRHGWGGGPRGVTQQQAKALVVE